MAFLTASKKSISALELQRQLGHKRYEPIWAMLHKIRLAMRYHDSKYDLKDYIELDEGFFETADRDGSKKDNENQQGRGSSRQAKVLVAVESIPVVTNADTKSKHKPNRKVKHLKMTVMDGKLTNEAINFEVQNQIDRKATLLTDGYRGYTS